METIQTIYEGELRTRAKHLQSGNEIITDAPVDNHGKGEAFSPTDLLAASLGSCMVTIMGIVVDRNNMNIDGTKMKINKVMGSNPRRVSEVIVEFDMPHNNFSDEEKEMLYNAAVNCPVAKSLHTEVKQTVKFNY
ncbi:MAG: osmotically inducible protein OsmC [Flavobacteriales bacterium]|nr:MAG: osmotically inducible protein OsmC [Flavobacteriales bacterium]